MIFNARTDAPLGAPPEQTEGDAQAAFTLCTEATGGFVSAIDAIRSNPELSPVGQQIAIAKLQAERAPSLKRAAELVKREASAVASAEHELKAAAGIVAPAPDSAAAWRAQEIRAKYATLSPSERNSVIHDPTTDQETLEAVYHAPALTNALSARDRETVESRLLERHDSARHQALSGRREDARRSAYALQVALGFIGRSRVPQPRVISSTANAKADYGVEAAERFADRVSGAPAPSLRERLDALHKNKQ